VLGQQVTALDRVGLYVPGGKAAYPSSVLMNAIPAKVAGVKELIMVVPTPDGVRNDLVLAAAAVAGVDRVFTIGGAQAVAALAYGTQTIPQVDKIVGPGNAYVAEAKRRVFGIVGIDMIAGPSEILVICDGKTDPDWIAMDLFSQAEHDELAQSILICPDAAYPGCGAGQHQQTVAHHAAAGCDCRFDRQSGGIDSVRDLDEAAEIANFIAPEHLELSVEDPDAMLPKIRHAGAIFMGRNTCEALGDYCAGPNHVLPTSRTARFSSPLGVYDFQKRSSLINVSAAGARTLGEIAALAYGEGLQAHGRSAEYRMGPRMARKDEICAGRDDIKPQTGQFRCERVAATDDGLPGGFKMCLVFHCSDCAEHGETIQRVRVEAVFDTFQRFDQIRMADGKANAQASQRAGFGQGLNHQQIRITQHQWNDGLATKINVGLIDRHYHIRPRCQQAFNFT
jgi:histidinol dehydrogenase